MLRCWNACHGFRQRTAAKATRQTSDDQRNLVIDMIARRMAIQDVNGHELGRRCRTCMTVAEPSLDNA